MRHIKAAEVRLAREDMPEEGISGAVHSVYRRTVNVLLEPGDGLPLLLTLYAAGGYNVPDSVALPPKDMAPLLRLQAGTAAVLAPGCLRVADCRVELGAISWRDSRFSRVSGAPPAGVSLGLTPIEGGGFSQLGELRARRLCQVLAAFAAAAARGDDAAATQALLAGVGAGCGLTPSFDDAVVGAAAILVRAGVGCFAAPGAAGAQRVARLVQGRTSLVSQKYLCCTWEGRFSDQLRALCDALFAGEDAGPHAAYLAGVGATSGRDMLAGVQTACRLLRGNFTERQ